MIVWLNGAFRPLEDAHIDPADRGFTLADGVFDTMLAVDGALQDAPAHFARLARHANVIDLTLQETQSALEKVAAHLLQKNNFTTGRHVLRTTLTRGPGARGLLPPEQPFPTLLMRVSPAAPVPDRLVRLIVATTTRRNEHSPLSRIKSLAYGDNLLALLEAKRQGADDAILLNTAGNISCATTSNIFIREDGTLITPPLADGALDGIMRQKLLDRGEAWEENVSAERLRDAPGILLSNSIAGIRNAVLA